MLPGESLHQPHRPSGEIALPLLVQKFGGTSVADAERILAAARRAIRAHRDGHQVIVVVSARGTEHDRIHALEIGADDYLVKPFSMKELVARVGAAARRGTRAQEPRRGDEIVIEELRLDPRNVQAYVDGASADLTPTEFRLVYALALEEGRVLTRDELLQRVWGRRATHRDRTVDVFVRKLREKIDARAPRHTFLHTRYGVGYKLEAVSK